jgi:hypothetical protein
MKIEMAKTALLMLMMTCCAVSGWAQGVVASGTQNTPDTYVVRVILDPHTAMRWLLERDPARPGGPRRMVLLSRQEGSEPELAGIANRIAKINRSIQQPVIRSGDRLVVEENSAVAEARLEAVALGSAVEGAEFRARLAIGGKILRAVALGPGRAAFAVSAGRP